MTQMGKIRLHVAVQVIVVVITTMLCLLFEDFEDIGLIAFLFYILASLLLHSYAADLKEPI